MLQVETVSSPHREGQILCLFGEGLVLQLRGWAEVGCPFCSHSQLNWSLLGLLQSPPGHMVVTGIMKP